MQYTVEITKLDSLKAIASAPTPGDYPNVSAPTHTVSAQNFRGTLWVFLHCAQLSPNWSSSYNYYYLYTMPLQLKSIAMFRC